MPGIRAKTVFTQHRHKASGSSALEWKKSSSRSYHSTAHPTPALARCWSRREGHCGRKCPRALPGAKESSATSNRLPATARPKTTTPSKSAFPPPLLLTPNMYHSNDTFMSQSKLERLEEAIHGIKREIGKIGALRPGSLSKQARKAKTPYGAYWHLSYTHRGKGHTQYIRDAFVPQVKAEVSNLNRFRKLIDRLITLSIERSQLRMKTDKKQ